MRRTSSMSIASQPTKLRPSATRDPGPPPDSPPLDILQAPLDRLGVPLQRPFPPSHHPALRLDLPTRVSVPDPIPTPRSTPDPGPGRGSERHATKNRSRIRGPGKPAADPRTRSDPTQADPKRNAP